MIQMNQQNYKLGEYAAIILKSLEYKNDIPKFVKYIRDNKEYFPNISEPELENIEKNILKRI
jgi:hypothetical protein